MISAFIITSSASRICRPFSFARFFSLNKLILFFRAMRSLDGFRGDCEMRVWLCQIAKNCYFDHCRRQKRLAAEQPPQQTAPSPESEIVLKYELDDIHRHLHALPEPYKEVFMLRVFGELSPAQIGSLFGRSANWACVVYHRARTMIRKKMEEEK